MVCCFARRYLSPTSPDKFNNAALVAIDVAAAIPLPVVKRLLSDNHLTFMCSTINGYEGTGRALSLKLIKDLREKSNAMQVSREQSRERHRLRAQMKSGKTCVHARSNED
jgi:N-acetyltransferase 10